MIPRALSPRRPAGTCAMPRHVLAAVMVVMGGTNGTTWAATLTPVPAPPGGAPGPARGCGWLVKI
ncbi:hypothetical protein [Novacetimonas hansenii]|uniref:hypothetical protein n=1 Tax=Novacetimonas hansenii TaxID=436 RepID=UPI0039E8F535